ncbi:lysine-specific demethylase 4A isoform X1 [Hydra vulgaris]
MFENENSKIMVFRPTFEEFKDFPKYISYMESKGAHHGGIAKVIPPKEWRPTQKYNMNHIGKIVIKTPVSQTITGQQGVFQLFNISKKSITVKDFKELAESTKYKTPNSKPEDLERDFWKNLTFNPPIYGADVPGTIYDKDCEYWNINKLGTILDILNASSKIKIKGVNTAYLYFGMWKTTFPWHTEDMDLYSINYLHFGAPKSWYAIPPEHGKRLETLAKGFFSGSASDCSEFLRHKMAIISPHVLRKFSIPVNKILQNEGEFIITFPCGYHAGYNQGFNCAESTNFASERWIDIGKKALYCKCINDSVKINMDIFIKHYQPNQWKEILKQQKTFNNNGKENTKFILKKVITDKDKSSSESESSPESLSESSPESNHIVQHKKENEYKQTNNSIYLKWKEIPKKRLKVHVAPEQCQKNRKNKDRSNNKNNHPIINKEELTPKQGSISMPLVWSHQSFDINSEIAYNRFVSSSAVKCAVCIYFSQNDSESLLTGISNQTTEKNILVTELCYTKNPSIKMNREVSFDYIFGEKESRHSVLLECSECFLRVHNICYCVEKADSEWVCDKCSFLKQQAISTINATLNLNDVYKKFDTVFQNSIDEKNICCCLCNLKGGALKRTTDGAWCHIVCAIAFPDVTFSNITTRGPINISNLDPARKKLKCLYCSQHSSSMKHMGACLQCKCRKCAVSFHVTCSFHYGIALRFGDWPTLIEVVCPKHARQKLQTVSEIKERPPVVEGDFVLAKHKNGRYYKAKVLETSMVLYYKVVFEDKSFCFDLPPGDIKSVNAKDHIILPGTEVDVLWPDSVTYPAEVIGHYHESNCLVSFEDGSVLNIKRNDLYAINEELPTKVKKKLSHASETLNKFNHSSPLQIGTKRLRKGSQFLSNTKFHL